MSNKIVDVEDKITKAMERIFQNNPLAAAYCQNIKGKGSLGVVIFKKNEKGVLTAEYHENVRVNNAKIIIENEEEADLGGFAKKIGSILRLEGIKMHSLVCAKESQTANISGELKKIEEEVVKSGVVERRNGGAVKL